MRKFVFLLVIGSVLAGLAACSSEPVCDYDKAPYIAAQSDPPLRVPAGLDAPDRSQALVIPPAPEGAAAKPSGKGRCLDRPPSYFATTKDGKQKINSGETKSGDTKPGK